MYNSFFKFYIPIIIIIICISLFIITIPNIQNPDFSSSEISQFYWPLPGNKNITSQFGKRTSPTSGASTYHSGIDIAATENTPIYACFSGQVTFTGFKGAGRLYNNYKKWKLRIILLSHISKISFQNR